MNSGLSSWPTVAESAFPQGLADRPRIIVFLKCVTHVFLALGAFHLTLQSQRFNSGGRCCSRERGNISAQGTISVPRRAAQRRAMIRNPTRFSFVAVANSCQSKEAEMGVASYRIAAHQGGWGVSHDGDTVGPYETKEAAFEATVAAASSAMREGHSIEITAPGREAEASREERTATASRNH
jgi:hypothetical protein